MDDSQLKDIYSEKRNFVNFLIKRHSAFSFWGQQCAVIDASELKHIYSELNNVVNFLIN
jgi:hypothetical protein